VREIVVRALCHGVIAQFATGMERELTKMQIDDWDLASALDADERALWDSGVDGLSVPALSIRLGYAEGSAFALMWALRMTDRLPAFDGTQSSYMDLETDLRCQLLDTIKSVDEMVASVALRALPEIADEIDYLTRYDAVYARDRPGWTFGEIGAWIGPLSPEDVACRLRALRWATRTDS
jgi:hypothetical protein